MSSTGKNTSTNPPKPPPPPSKSNNPLKPPPPPSKSTIPKTPIDSTPQDNTIKMETVEDDSNNNNNYNVINEKTRNVYTIAPLTSSPKNTFLTIGEDQQMMIVKVSPTQKMYPNEYHYLINVRYGNTTDQNKIKTVKSGDILKGKRFAIKMDELQQKVLKTNIPLVGVGRSAQPITDEELWDAKEDSIIEKLSAKVCWMSSNAFENGELNIKVLTERGKVLMITLEEAHHQAVRTNRIYNFIKIIKTRNWSSTSPVFRDVEMKFRAKSSSTIIEEIDRPSAAFKELGKEIGKVNLIEQDLTVFDQCKSCFKGRWNNECNNSDCIERGKVMPPNPRFHIIMVIEDKDENTLTVKVWSDQLVDLPSTFHPMDKDDLGKAIALHEIEKHFLDKEITFRRLYKRDGMQIIGDVALKLPSSMDFS